MVKILILSDSLPLPRKHPEECEYEKCWPQLLSQKHTVCQLSIGGGTISDIKNQIYYYQMFKPDIVILQSGIVDCAPRSLSRTELIVFTKMGIFGKLFLEIAERHKYRFRKHRGITYSNQKKYKANVLQIMNFFSEAKLLSVGIVLGCPDYEKDVPNISANIEKYNKILAEEFKDGFLPLNNMPRNAIMSDYVHLNAKGHEFIYKMIIENEILK